MQRQGGSQQSEGHVLYMGLMMKRGGFRKNWNLRWFEITKTHLIYFKFAKDGRSTDYAAKVKGVVKLADCLNVYRGKERIAKHTGRDVSWPDARYPPSRDGRATIALKTKKRTYYMVAQTREAAKHWESILRQSCSEVKPTFSSGITESKRFMRDPQEPYDRRMTMSKMGVKDALLEMEERGDMDEDTSSQSTGSTCEHDEEEEPEFLDADSMDGDSDRER